jgi:hypothetical protein
MLATEKSSIFDEKGCVAERQKSRKEIHWIGREGSQVLCLLLAFATPMRLATI